MRAIASGPLHTVFQFGDLRIISLRDGYVDLPTTRLRNANDEPLHPLPKSVTLVDGKLRLSVNAFLVDDPRRRVLIDSGASNSWDPSMGGLPAAFDEAGESRETITDIAITHNHEDHVNGLIAPDGSETFPRLERIFIGAKDVGVFTGRLQELRDRVVPLSSTTQISDRITARPIPGHTNGHTAYDVRSSEGHMIAWGDTVHVPSLQFDHPEVVWELDQDQQDAFVSRADLLHELARPRYFVAGAHLDSPGIARVISEGSSYRVEYVGDSC